MGGGRASLSCGLWRAVCSRLIPAALIGVLGAFPPCPLTAFLPFRGPSCSLPTTGGRQGPGGWRGRGRNVCRCVHLHECMWGGVSWRARVGTTWSAGAEGLVVTHVGGFWGRGKDVMGPRQLQVSSYLCGDLLSLDTGISFRPPDLLLSSNTHLPCGNGPVFPSLWASVSLSVEERD